MARKSRVKIDMQLDDVITAIAGFDVMEKAVDNDSQYMYYVMYTAHEESLETFHEVAAATATTVGIEHMYEWGTVGINTGRSSMRPSPLEPRARLWEDTIDGQGMNFVLGYDFKPSTATVPKLTTRDSGIDQEVIKRMKTHIFWNKAMVMETGASVRITRKDAEFLLIPTSTMEEQNVNLTPKTYDRKRGYMLRKVGYNAQPGHKSMGKFNSMWVAYWAGQGIEQVKESIQKQIVGDFLDYIEADTKTPRKSKKPVNIEAQKKREAKKIEKAVTAKAKERFGVYFE
jgi:hypothetical protein